MRASRLLVLVLPLVACASQPARERLAPRPAGGAVPVESWPGTPKLTREGDVYFAGQPDEAGLRHAAEVGGVAVVVNLRTTGEMEKVGFDEAALVESLGMRYVQIPLKPPSFGPPDVDLLADTLQTASGPVLVHCKSSNRVGGIWAAYLAREKGLALEAALERGKAAGLRRPVMVEARY